MLSSVSSPGASLFALDESNSFMNNRRPTSKNFDSNWVRSEGPASLVPAAGDCLGSGKAGFPVSKRDNEERELGRLTKLLCVGSSPISYIELNDARLCSVGCVVSSPGGSSRSTVPLYPPSLKSRRWYSSVSVPSFTLSPISSTIPMCRSKFSNLS